MASQALNIVRDAVLPKPDKYNILTFSTHERYETQLAKTGHNFYVFNTNDMKRWQTEYAEIPDNYYILPDNAIYPGIKYDFILSQSKFGQFQTAAVVNTQLNLPVVSLEHTFPTPNLKDEWLAEIKTMAGDINVFISEHSRDAWDIRSPSLEVIHHSVDSELFKPLDIDTKPYLLSVVNDFANRDYCCNYEGWKRVTAELPTKLLGSNEGLSEPAPSIQALVEEYNQCRVFLNTSTLSPVPTALLEAMSCGSAVVSTATCMIPEVIENGVNGFISNDEEELRGYIQKLFKDEDLAKELGDNARKTILEKFSEERFINDWNRIFDLAYEVRK